MGASLTPTRIFRDMTGGRFRAHRGVGPGQPVEMGLDLPLWVGIRKARAPNEDYVSAGARLVPDAAS
jgi:hypothetical protein